jgi:hypothetical protein
VIALRVPLYSSLGIATLVTSGLLLLPPAPHVPSARPLDVPELDATECTGTLIEVPRESEQPACDPNAISAVVIRGQFTSHQGANEGFAISFPGPIGHYTAMTDPRGYFEVRIPREDFDGDVCQLPPSHDFSDEHMTLKYRIDVER